MQIAESEIYKAVFDLVQSIADQPDLETLCKALASSLRRVISFDFVALLLHDPIRDQLRLHALSIEALHPEQPVVIPLVTCRGEFVSM